MRGLSMRFIYLSTLSKRIRLIKKFDQAEKGEGYTQMELSFGIQLASVRRIIRYWRMCAAGKEEELYFNDGHNRIKAR